VATLPQFLKKDALSAIPFAELPRGLYQSVKHNRAVKENTIPSSIPPSFLPIHPSTFSAERFESR